MTGTEALQITTPTDREVVLTRVVNAPRRLVFDPPSLFAIAACAASGGIHICQSA